MNKKIEDYLHLYLECQIIVEPHDDEMSFVDKIEGLVIGESVNLKKCGDYYFDDINEFAIKPILRRLDSMTEAEMIGLLQSMTPDDMENKPTDEDYELEMFYNDNAAMVDGDVAVGAEVTCICWIAQIAITHDGTIHQRSEDGELEKQTNVPEAYRYLLSKHFDLFGLIEAGLAVASPSPNTNTPQPATHE